MDLPQFDELLDMGFDFFSGCLDVIAENVGYPTITAPSTDDTQAQEIQELDYAVELQYALDSTVISEEAIFAVRQIDLDMGIDEVFADTKVMTPTSESSSPLSPPVLLTAPTFDREPPSEHARDMTQWLRLNTEPIPGVKALAEVSYHQYHINNDYRDAIRALGLLESKKLAMCCLMVAVATDGTRKCKHCANRDCEKVLKHQKGYIGEKNMGILFNAIRDADMKSEYGEDSMDQILNNVIPSQFKKTTKDAAKHGVYCGTMSRQLFFCSSKPAYNATFDRVMTWLPIIHRAMEEHNIRFLKAAPTLAQATARKRVMTEEVHEQAKDEIIDTVTPISAPTLSKRIRVENELKETLPSVIQQSPCATASTSHSLKRVRVGDDEFLQQSSSTIMMPDPSLKRIRVEAKQPQDFARNMVTPQKFARESYMVHEEELWDLSLSTPTSQTCYQQSPSISPSKPILRFDCDFDLDLDL